MSNAGLCLTAIVLVLVVGLPLLGERDLMPPDEARYGEIALALNDGRAPLLVPLSNGSVYPDKPPGYFWAIHACARVVGDFHEGILRLPSVLGATMAALGVALIAGPAVGFAAALLGVLLMVGTAAFSWQLRFAQMDMLVAGIVSLMMACFYRSWASGERMWCLPAMLLLGYGAFIKGPLAPIALLAFMIWVVITGRPRALFNGPAAAGLLLVAAACWFWVRLASIQLNELGPGEQDSYWGMMFGRHVRDRLTGSVAHDKPWWAFARMLPVALLPATPLLLLLAGRQVRARMTPAAKALLGFGVVWVTTTLIVLSIPAGKRDIYLLPLFPGIGLLLAALASALSDVRCRVGLAWSAIVALLGLAIAVPVLLVALDPSRIAAWASTIPRIERLVESESTDWLATLIPSRFIVYGALLTGVALACLASAAKGRTRLAVGLAALLSAITINGAAACVIPVGNPLFSRRGVAAMVESEWQRRNFEGPVYFFHHLDEGVPFYLKRPTPEIPAPAQVPGLKRLDPRDPEHRELARAALKESLGGDGVLMLARERDLDRFYIRPGLDYREVDRRELGSGKRFVLIEGSPR